MKYYAQLNNSVFELGGIHRLSKIMFNNEEGSLKRKLLLCGAPTKEAADDFGEE